MKRALQLVTFLYIAAAFGCVQMNRTVVDNLKMGQPDSDGYYRTQPLPVDPAAIVGGTAIVNKAAIVTETPTGAVHHSTKPPADNPSSADLKDASTKAILGELPNASWLTSIQKADDKGNLNYLVASAELDKGKYKVTYEYIRFRLVPLQDPKTKEVYAMARIGVGMRVDANVVTNKSGIDLGSLMKLGIAASTEQASGTVQVVTIGIASPAIDGANFGVTDIKEDSIAKIYQGAGAIGAKIDDPTTQLTPTILYVKFNDAPTASVKSTATQ